MNYIRIVPLNVVLPAGSITHATAIFEKIDSRQVARDWAANISVNVQSSIRKTLRIFVWKEVAEFLSMNGVAVQELSSVPPQAETEEAEDEEEVVKPRRGRKKKVVEETTEIEEAGVITYYYVDIPVTEYVLESEQVAIEEDEAFNAFLESADAERAKKFLQTLTRHAKQIVELGEPAGLPSVEGDDDDDNLTAAPVLTNDVMTATHVAYRKQQEVLRAKIEKRYNSLDNVLADGQVSIVPSNEAVELLTLRNIKVSSFEEELQETVKGFDF